MSSYPLLEKAIQKRIHKRGLHGDLSHMQYFNRCLLQDANENKISRALYVGVGHGHNALLSLMEGRVETVVGVDPFISSDGNDSEDYYDLLRLIDECGLGERFTVEKTDVAAYLKKSCAPFDLIICSDVLHHIFVTEKLLHESDAFSQSADLFKNFAQVIHKEGLLIISEVQRNGIRQILKKSGLGKTHMDYRTKQPWQEWNQAAIQAEWILKRVRNYVPYRFRKMHGIFEGLLARYTLCDKYFLTYSL